MHAANPMDWYPWGPEALAKAKRENKVIFLSIGYSTCFWCHVAERLLYSIPTVAADLNAFFVNIKVDREERPDLDGVYMLAREMKTGSGGWPNNVFLTPDLKPFYAGSYFPPEDTDGQPGFRTTRCSATSAPVRRNSSNPGGHVTRHDVLRCERNARDLRLVRPVGV